MGSVCSGISFFRDISFTPRYKEQLVSVIEHTCDPEKDYERQTRSIKNLKKQMVVVRGLTNSWSELTDMCANRNDPPSVMFRKILDEISAADEEIRVSEVLCMCTYVSDVCVKLVSKNEKNKVCEMVEFW